LPKRRSVRLCAIRGVSCHGIEDLTQANLYRDARVQGRPRRVGKDRPLVVRQAGRPDLATLDIEAVVLVAIAALLLLRLKLSIGSTFAISASAALAWFTLLGAAG
jgi:hypothetical protein